MLLLAASHFRLWANTEYFSKTGRKGITFTEEREKSFIKALLHVPFHQTHPRTQLACRATSSSYIIGPLHWLPISQYVYPCWMFDLNYTQFTISFRTHVVLPCPHTSMVFSTALANLSQHLYPSWILDFNSSQFTENSVKDEAGSCKEGNAGAARISLDPTTSAICHHKSLS